MAFSGKEAFLRRKLDRVSLSRRKCFNLKPEGEMETRAADVNHWATGLKPDSRFLSPVQHLSRCVTLLTFN